MPAVNSSEWWWWYLLRVFFLSYFVFNLRRDDMKVELYLNIDTADGSLLLLFFEKKWISNMREATAYSLLCHMPRFKQTLTIVINLITINGLLSWRHWNQLNPVHCMQIVDASAWRCQKCTRKYVYSWLSSMKLHRVCTSKVSSWFDNIVNFISTWWFIRIITHRTCP